MISELVALTRHAEILASQERAIGRAGSARGIMDFLARARPVLAAIDAPGAESDVSPRELSMLHGFVVEHVARAERERGSTIKTIRAGGAQERA